MVSWRCRKSGMRLLSHVSLGKFGIELGGQAGADSGEGGGLKQLARYHQLIRKSAASARL